MRGFLARILITAFGLWLADLLLDGITFDSVASLWVAALLLGLANAVIRPILIVLTLPITLMSLGLFLLVINGLMVLLVARLMSSFHIAGLGPAIVTSILVGLTGWIANGFVGDRGKVELWVAKK